MTLVWADVYSKESLEQQWAALLVMCKLATAKTKQLNGRTQWQFQKRN